MARGRTIRIEMPAATSFVSFSDCTAAEALAAARDEMARRGSSHAVLMGPSEGEEVRAWIEALDGRPSQRGLDGKGFPIIGFTEAMPGEAPSIAVDERLYLFHTGQDAQRPARGH